MKYWDGPYTQANNMEIRITNKEGYDMNLFFKRVSYDNYRYWFYYDDRLVFSIHGTSLPGYMKNELNAIVIEQSVPRIMSQVAQYFGYLHDVQHLPIPIDLPKNLSNKGTKLLNSVTSTF